MSTVLTAAAIMSALALVFGIMLATAYRYLKVVEDPRIEKVEEMLPGSNCGACGQPGCRAFAESLIQGGNQPSGCTVSSAAGIEGIAAFLGVSAGSAIRRVARLHCAGGKGFVAHAATYSGISSCRGAVLVNGGGRSCHWGCLGLGDCERACDFDVIHMNKQGLPVVDTSRCTACNDCVEVCPMDLFTLEPIENKLLIQCSNPLAGHTAREGCRVACDSCGRCALDAPDNSVVMENGLPVVVDAARATQKATFRCPTGAIQWVEGNQFEVTESL